MDVLDNEEQILQPQTCKIRSKTNLSMMFIADIYEREIALTVSLSSISTVLEVEKDEEIEEDIEEEKEEEEEDGK
jgi:hypothetical protein